MLHRKRVRADASIARTRVSCENPEGGRSPVRQSRCPRHSILSELAIFPFSELAPVDAAVRSVLGLQPIIGLAEVSVAHKSYSHTQRVSRHAIHTFGWAPAFPCTEWRGVLRMPQDQSFNLRVIRVTSLTTLFKIRCFFCNRNRSLCVS